MDFRYSSGYLNRRYTNNSFRSDYKGTVGVDFALKVLRINAETRVKLQLWDVAGLDLNYTF